MNIATRIYTLSFLSSVGNWLTFLAVALLIKEEYGADKVALGFLIQSLGPLFLSNYFARNIPQKKQFSIYLVSLILAAANVALLVFSLGLWQIYLYYVLSSIIGAFSRPLFFSMLGEWIEKDQIAKVHTRIGSIQAAVLAFAPPLGGFLTIYFGFEALFILDALTFLIGIPLLLPKPKVVNEHVESVKTPLIIPVKESELPVSLRKRLYTWYVYLGVGAILNALEFKTFEQADFSRSDIGIIIGAWGTGALLSFVFNEKFSSRMTATSMAIYASVAFVVFAMSQNLWLSTACFVVGAFGNSLIGGTLRGDIQNTIPDGIKPLSIWSLVNKRLSLINIAFYGGISFSLPYVDYGYYVGLLLVACVIFVWSCSRKESGVNPAYS
jgi:MFS family permease